MQDASRLHLPTIALNPRLTLWGWEQAHCCCVLPHDMHIRAQSWEGTEPFLRSFRARCSGSRVELHERHAARQHLF